MNAKGLSLLFAFISTILSSTFCSAADVSPHTRATTKFTDPEIASIVVAANTVDIDAGKLAGQLSSNSKVQAFAKKMENDHTSVNKQAVELVTRLGVTPKENEVSKTLLSDGQRTRERLRALQGASFDKAYIDNEVTYHEQVIDLVKTRLVPEATNKDLRELLVKVSPTFAEHLEHAKALQSELVKEAR